MKKKTKKHILKQLFWLFIALVAISLILLTFLLMGQVATTILSDIFVKASQVAIK